MPPRPCEWTSRRGGVYGRARPDTHPFRWLDSLQTHDALEVPEGGSKLSPQPTRSTPLEPNESRKQFQALGLLAQLVEQRTFNPTVQGSSP